MDVLAGKMLLAIVAAAAAGAAMSFQGVFNAALSKRVSLPVTSVAVHLVGLVLSAVVVGIVLLLGRRFLPDGFNLSQVPGYAYLGGVLSVLIIIGVASAFKVTGAGLGVAVIVTAQLAAAMVIDNFGWFESPRVAISWLRVLGVALLVVGTRLVAK